MLVRRWCTGKEYLGKTQKCRWHVFFILFAELITIWVLHSELITGLVLF